MKNSSRIIFVALLVLVAVTQLMAGGNKTATQAVSDQDKRKAEYIYLQAMAYKAQDSIAAYYDLVKHAYQLDSTNTAISFYYGYLLTLKDNSSSEVMNRGLDLMKKHVDAHPEDFFEATFFSDACMSLKRNDLALSVIEKQAEINPNKTEVQMRLAAAYVKNEKYAQALEVYEKIEELEGKSVEIAVYKTALCSQLGDTTGAINQMRSFYNTAPANVEYNLLMSELFRQCKMQDSAMYYLDQIRLLCEEKGITLLLVRAPIEYRWHKQWDTTVEEYAAKYGLTYINFNNYSEEMGIDMSTDTYDGGQHLNIYGAEKLSVFFGKYLMDNYGLTDYRTVPEVAKEYEKDVAFYNWMRDDQLAEIEKYGELRSYGANAIEK